MRPRLIAVDDARIDAVAVLVAHASMRPRLIAVDDVVGGVDRLEEQRLQ